MVPYFDQILDRFETSKKIQILNILEIWSDHARWDATPFDSCNHKKIIENLKNEHYLNDEDFFRLLNQLLIHYAGDIVTCLQTLKSYIFASFLKKGDLVQKKPIYVGTTVGKQSFYTYIQSCGYSKSDVERLIRRSPSNLNRDEKQLLLKEGFKLVWLTWDEEGDHNPFKFMKEINSRNVFNAFALDDQYDNQEMMSFTFRLDRSIADFLIYRPTWCDATFFDKFHPTDPAKEMRWGLTYPQVPYPIHEDYEVRRPEGVIETDRLPLKYLIQPINLLPL